jgi:transcriptional regulator with XRE-family HTH domain
VKKQELLERAVIIALRDLRLRQGIDYGEMARRTKLHRTSISLIERGLRHPSFVAVLKMAEALGVDVADLLRQHTP